MGDRAGRPRQETLRQEAPVGHSEAVHSSLREPLCAVRGRVGLWPWPAVAGALVQRRGWERAGCGPLHLRVAPPAAAASGQSPWVRHFRQNETRALIFTSFARAQRRFGPRPNLKRETHSSPFDCVSSQAAAPAALHQGRRKGARGRARQSERSGLDPAGRNRRGARRSVQAAAGAEGARAPPVQAQAQGAKRCPLKGVWEECDGCNR